ncbi:hypothetical protein Psuf_088150 [Phytohabitans suffuscus]|uniref:ABC transmembrane type-1 domain-containing protein n=1 Tax=Phytohabitans suffuscus TaxID=624315 RepID=A0A6F8YZI5_9ACTN|nr:hypothetical protein Psuf_088150 [Phytohabitans suffuscus]
MPVLIGVVIDSAVATGSVSRLVLWLAVLGGVFAVLSFSWRFGARAAERASEWAGHDLRVRLTRRILDPRGGAETGRLAGELTSIATGDARRVGGVNVVLPSAVAALTGLLVSAVALLWISVPLGLVVLLGAPPLLWLGHLLGRPLERRSAVEQERAAHASGVAADLVAGLRVLKGIGAERAAVARYRGTSQESLAATLRAARTQAAHDGAILALTGLFIAAVALVGGRLAAAGDISVGDLVAAVGLALFLLNPLQLFAWVNAELAQGRASAKRIAAVLAAPPAVTAGGAAPPEPVRGHVRLRGVHHGPLSGVDLEVAPGELLGVVAPDPAAATALLSTLALDAEPARARWPSTASRCPHWTRPACAAPSSSPPTTPPSSPAPCWRTSPRPAPPPARRSAARWPPPPPTRWPAASRTARTRRSASARSRCPAGSASASHWPARSPPTRRSWCCTTRRRRWTR